MMAWGTMGGLWWLWMVGFWGLFLAGVAWLVVTLNRPRDHPAGRHGATAILDRRLASGEISIEEYQERRKILAVNAR